MEAPETSYARSGDVSIAYQVVGDGPFDIVLSQGFVHNLAFAWEQPLLVRSFQRLASFGRLIRFDRRGTGLSDRVREVPTLEAQMDDVRAVMDAAGSDRAALIGTYEAGAMTALFSATYPERTAALVLYNASAKGLWSPDYPWASTPDEWRTSLATLERGWGSAEYSRQMLRGHYPALDNDEGFRRWFENAMRFGASPAAALTVSRMQMDVDVRDLLPTIRVPTLVLHRRERREEASYLADRIPGAKRTELPGEGGAFFADDFEVTAAEIERFVRAQAQQGEPDTVLATVLFTDIVGSTERAAELGDRAWAELVQRHHALVRAHLGRFRGREIDTAGDGFFASFDGAARGIRCACAISQGVRELGLHVRAGLHTGECELVDDKVGGIAVHIGARVAAEARPGEVLVSSTVKDLVAGSGISFEERGVAELKGVPGEWRLFAVESA